MRSDSPTVARPVGRSTGAAAPDTATRYQVGLDLGTTFTVAAVRRTDGDRPLPAELVTLDDGRAAVPTAVFVGAGGELRFGRAAVEAGQLDPTRLVRGFRRRVGDPTPVIVAGKPWNPEDLTARLARWAVDRIAPGFGGLPDRIAVTHPVSWGAHTSGLLRRALEHQGLTAVLLGEPQAAVSGMVADRGLAPGSTVGVYDLGGGTFDAAVVRTATDGGPPDVLGSAERDDRLGGADFDDVVFEHVKAALPDLFAGVDETAVTDMAAMARIRHACTAAKERLSSDTEASIPVALSGQETTVRLHRSEFEHLVRPLVERSVDCLERAIAAAGLKPRDLTDLLLVGGSSRIPLVSQLVSERLDRPVAVDGNPSSVAARGAALMPTANPAHAGSVPARSRQPEQATGTVPVAGTIRPTRPVVTPAAADWIVPDPGPPARMTGWTVAGFVALGAATAVVAAAAIVTSVLLGYPAPGVGVDIPMADTSSPAPAGAPAAVAVPQRARPPAAGPQGAATGAVPVALTSAPPAAAVPPPTEHRPAGPTTTAPATHAAAPVQRTEPVEPTVVSAPVQPVEPDRAPDPGPPPSSSPPVQQSSPAVPAPPVPGPPVTTPPATAPGSM